MRVFKISVKFEQNRKWSDREADAEGYLVKKSDESDEVEGYIKTLYPTVYDPVRYISGLYTGDSLIFMQLCNTLSVSPICYCFPNINEQGFWSNFNETFGFFPYYPMLACSQGHATLKMEEITDSTQNEVGQNASAVFCVESGKAPVEIKMLIEQTPFLTNFLDEGLVFQMKLHCGKW